MYVHTRTLNFNLKDIRLNFRLFNDFISYNIWKIQSCKIQFIPTYVIQSRSAHLFKFIILTITKKS